MEFKTDFKDISMEDSLEEYKKGRDREAMIISQDVTYFLDTEKCYSTAKHLKPCLQILYFYG